MSNLKKQKAFSLFEIMLAAFLFLLIILFVNKFLSSSLESPAFQVNNEEVLEKIQQISGYQDTTAIIDNKVDTIFQLTTTNVCSTNQPAPFNCTKLEIMLPSGEIIRWYVHRAN